MNVVVKNRIRTPLVVPPAVRRLAGHKNDEELEFRVSGDVITIRPKAPATEDQYTARQRRTVNARLAKADADIKAGRVSNAFSDHDEFISALHKEAAKSPLRKARRSAR
jgi:hypothetical protein